MGENHGTTAVFDGRVGLTGRALRRNVARIATLLLTAGVLQLVVAPVPASGVAPVGQGFNLNRSDVRFILKQIQISERHAREATATAPCKGLLGSGPDQIPDQGLGLELPWGLRTVDGSCNNLTGGRERWGAADTVFPRLVPAQLRDAETGDPDGPGSAPSGPTSYAQTSGTVIDSAPRVVSNLIVDQTRDNPAAVAASGLPASTPAGVALSIPNTAPDVGLSAPYNSWFTMFGQFFDHGLDLVAKGGSGTVFMPLATDDPLYNPTSQTNFMLLTRTTKLPGPDGRVGTPDDVHEAKNTTTSYVDQNQTYTSHPSHQVFLREFVASATGPVETGRLITNADGGMADWSTVKSKAASLLGIQLVDTDVLNVPLLETDPYGNFVRGPNGFPRIVTASGPVNGDPTANGGAGVLLPADTVRTGHAFLDDIAHHAAPMGRTGPLTPDADTTLTTDDGDRATYDDEMLGRHFVAGDGRANENIGLTAVHHVFHSEHNRLTGYLQDLISEVEATNPAMLAEWQVSPASAGTPAVWDGDRLFQAARFVNEMEYQHLVFEEFARKVQPMVNPFGAGGTGYNPGVNADIRAEFAHAVYRFGHSMLTEDVARTNANGSDNSLPLLDAFLDPTKFLDGKTAGQLTPDEAAGSIVRGMTRQVGEEIDEFVTEALRNHLVGLPLDLAAINMARARETGVPTLNEARAKFFAASGNTALTPYASWADLVFGLRHRESLVNFVAAYGTHPSITGGYRARRAAAQLLVDANPTNPNTPTDAYEFLNGVGTTWAGRETGVNRIDLWVGGLAEKQMVFGGLLGSTFNYVFEKQMEDLQDGDRFYYLSRTAGLNMLTQLEGNSFSELVMRNTDVTSLPADSFSRPDFVFEVGALGTSGAVPDDPGTVGYTENTLLTRSANGTIRFAGPEHVVFNGTDTAGAIAPAYDDRIWASEGDDTLRGNGGRDWMEGGDGADNLIGGAGDDTLTDLFGDDVFKGGDGDDTISSGQGFGLDLNQGGRGDDFVIHGNDAAETFGGAGDDLVLGGDGGDTVFGDDGDDWIDGGRGAGNLLQGDNGAPFQDDLNEPGNDVLDGDGGAQDMDAEGGDDIMLSGPGLQRAEGMRGFDWVTHQGDPLPADSDMAFTGLLPPTPENNRDRFDLVEALSGYGLDDVLRGDNRTVAQLTAPAGDPTNRNVLDAAGIARITGLDRLLPAGATSYDAGNIIIGGGGSDVIEGRGGDDLIDGDAQLQVQLKAPDGAGGSLFFSSLTELRADALAGRLDPGQVDIVRSIVTPAPNGAVDTAAFSGPASEYTVTNNLDGTKTVAHTGGTGLDGTDTLRGIELLVFGTAPPVALLPDAPAVLSVTEGDAQALVTFAPVDAGGPQVSELRIRVMVGSAVARTVTGIAPTATSALVTGLTNGVQVRFATVAVGAGGSSAPSAMSQPVIPSRPPGSPGPVAGAPGDARATVSWAAPTDDGGRAVTSYQLEVSSGDSVVDTLPVADPAATSQLVTGLTNGVGYQFRVRAVNFKGAGTWSDPSAPVWPAATPDAPTPATTPDAPTIEAATGGNAAATVRWIPGSGGGDAIIEHQLEVRVGDTVVRTIAGIAPSASSLVVTGLANGTAYTFRVRAVNGVGAGPLSAASNVVTPATLPGAPVIGKATSGRQGGPNTAKVSWQAPTVSGGAAITGYRVLALRIGKKGSVVRTIASAVRPAGSRSFRMTLAKEGKYRFRVIALSPLGASARSGRSNAVVGR